MMNFCLQSDGEGGAESLHDLVMCRRGYMVCSTEIRKINRFVMVGQRKETLCDTHI